MSENFIRFIQDVASQLTPYMVTFDNDYNMLYTNYGQSMIISTNEVKKYYDGYLLSHQTRQSAINRASISIKKMIETVDKRWSKMI